MTDYRLSEIERLLREKEAGHITQRAYERQALKVIQEVHLAIEDEYTLSRLFGQAEGHGTSSYFMPVATWRHWLKKIAHHLARYMNENLRFTDHAHARDVELELEHFRRAIDSATEREPGLVLSLVSLCLVVAGDRPNHWDHRHVGHAVHFSLRSVRDVAYSQDWNQRALLIFRECQRPRWILGLDDTDARRAIERYGRGLNSQATARAFVEWFRGEYGEAYGNLFLI